MESRAELARVRAESGPDGEPPAGYELERVSYPGDDRVLDHARAVLAAYLEGRELPDWFVERCIDDSEIKTCEVKRWSLRAWRYWLDAENRRWWWWSAQALPEGQVEVVVLVRSKPWLRGALDWLLQVSREAAEAAEAAS